MKPIRKLLALLASIFFVCYVAFDPFKITYETRYYNTPLWYMLYGAIIVLLVQSAHKTYSSMNVRITRHTFYIKGGVLRKDNKYQWKTKRERNYIP